MEVVSGVLRSSIRHDGARESHDCSPFLRGLEMYMFFFEGLDWRLRSLSKYSIFISEILISGHVTPNVCLSCIKEPSYQFCIREKLIEKFLALATL